MCVCVYVCVCEECKGPQAELFFSAVSNCWASKESFGAVLGKYRVLKLSTAPLALTMGSCHLLHMGEWGSFVRQGRSDCERVDEEGRDTKVWLFGSAVSNCCRASIESFLAVLGKYRVVKLPTPSADSGFTPPSALAGRYE